MAGPCGVTQMQRVFFGPYSHLIQTKRSERSHSFLSCNAEEKISILLVVKIHSLG